MPLVRLTARNVRILPSGVQSRLDYLDEILPGFTLRVSPTGVRAFAVTYFREGKLRRYTIGRTPPLSLAHARGIARRVLADVTKGGDPQHEKILARRKRTAGTASFADLARRFLVESSGRLRPVTLENWGGIVRAEVIPALGNLRPEDVTRQDVRDLVRNIAKSGRPYWANRVFEVIRRVFTWAVSEDLLAASPCVGLRKPAEERPRDRVLSSDEIRSVWTSLDGAGVFAEAVRLLLYTAARPREVLDARWSEIDMAERLWRIPAYRMKNREPHVVPLSAGAAAVIDRVRAASGDSDEWLFPSPVTGSPLRGVAKNVNRIRERAGVSFQLRDIRRTVRTRLRELGVSQDVCEAILSHVPSKLVRTYDRYEPVPEMRSGLEAWSARLEAIVSGETRRAAVIPLSRG